jgi:ribose 5-phosphate isomerase A
MRILADMGAAPVIRGNYRTDQGNIVIDCHFATLEDPRATAVALSAIPGILGHGLFLDEVDAAYIATNGVVTRLERVGASD